MNVDREQVLKECKLKMEKETMPLTIQIPVKKYRALMELARKTQTESLTYFKGEAFLDCENCPIEAMNYFCTNADDFSELVDKDSLKIFCHGAFMRWLFDKED